MKIILSVSLLSLVYLSSNFSFFAKVDYTGIYYSNNTSSPKIISNQLHLKKDQTFEYKFISYNAMTNVQMIRGTYKVSGNQLNLIPDFFQTSVTNFRTDKNSGKVISNDHRKKIITPESPKLFKKTLSRFETNNFRLQPSYTLKKIKKQLSLCTMDIKTELYNPQFLKP